MKILLRTYEQKLEAQFKSKSLYYLKAIKEYAKMLEENLRRDCVV